MRLELRRKLHPYATLLELADALDVTLPKLQRRLRELEARDELTLEQLAATFGGKSLSPRGDDLFVRFHRNNLCLVCGSPMEQVRDRQAGWGEFEQCVFCLFSVHENADFERMRDVASHRLEELNAAHKEAERIFRQRVRRGKKLK